MQPLHRLDISPARLRRLVVWVIQFLLYEELRGTVRVVSPAATGYLLYDLRFDLPITYGFHHCQVLEVVVCLE